jgi:hypothetical protein
MIERCSSGKLECLKKEKKNGERKDGYYAGLF